MLVIINKEMQENVQENDDEKQSVVPKPAVGTRAYYIQKIRVLGEKLQKNTKQYKLSRLKKVELANLLGQ